MPNYGDSKYWEERYKSQKDTTFDWLEDYETLSPIINDFKLCKETCQIINLGCGNAEFSENMYDDGYKNIMNIDISENVIKNMQERNNNRKEMQFEVMDVRKINFPNNHFDLAIDKSTIDALLCGERSFINVAIMLNEVQRVIKEGGIYMIISYGTPENRIFHLERDHLGFDINIFTIKKDYTVDDNNKRFEKIHYVYICKKKAGADELCRNNLDKVITELESEEKIEQEFYNLKNLNNYEKDDDDEDEEDEEDEIKSYEEDYFDDEDDRFSSENKENSDL